MLIIWFNFYISGRRKYLLLAMDMAKVGGPLSFVKVCTSMLCATIRYPSVGGPLSAVFMFPLEFDYPCALPTNYFGLNC